MTQEGPKRAPRGPRESLKKAIGGPKVSPREPQESPKTANAFQESPQRAPGQPWSPKTTQKCPPRGPRNATNTDVLLVCVDVGKLKSSVSIRSQTEGPRRPQRPRRRAPEAPKTTPTEGIRRDFPRPTAPQRPPKRSLETPTELRQAPKRLQSSPRRSQARWRVRQNAHSITYVSIVRSARNKVHGAKRQCSLVYIYKTALALRAMRLVPDASRESNKASRVSAAGASMSGRATGSFYCYPWTLLTLRSPDGLARLCAEVGRDR